MKRRVFNVQAVMSLLAFVAVCWIAIRSNINGGVIYWRWLDRTFLRTEFDTGMLEIINSNTGNVIYIPLFLFAVLFVVLPMKWLSGQIRAFRSARLRSQQEGNRCSVCGYDLRATPDRCPECGTVPKKNLIPK